MRTDEIARRRMVAHRLWDEPLSTPAEVVRRLGAVQAQVYPYARWSLAQRGAGFGAADVDRALAEGEIVRTHILRPTWHFVHRDDLRWMLAISAPRVTATIAARRRQLGLDAALFAKAAARLERALSGGARLTRKELGAALTGARIDPDGQRLPHILMQAELDGIVCSGGLRGKQQTYASFDERVPARGASMDHDDAVDTLVRRYFTSHGPATVKDFVWWSGLKTSDVRRGIEAAGAALAHDIVGARTYWFPAGAATWTARPPKVDLVQSYDECIVAYSESRDVLRHPGTGEGAPLLEHSVLLDGRVIGRWRLVRGRGGATVDTALDAPLSPGAARVLRAAAERCRAVMA